MRKIIATLLCAAVVFAFPTVCFAENDNVTLDGMTVNFDDKWAVFTPNNYNEDFLAQNGISEEYMDECFSNNEEIEVDAFLINNNTDLFIKTVDNPGLDNLSAYSNSDLEEFLSVLSEKTGSDDGKIINVNGYKYSEMSYYNEATDSYIYELCTVVNGIGYVFTAQREEMFDDDTKAIIKTVLENDVEYEAAPVPEQEYTVDEDIKPGFSWICRLIIVTVIAAIFGIIGAVGGSARSKRKKNEEQKYEIATDESWKENTDYSKIDSIEEIEIGNANISSKGITIEKGENLNEKKIVEENKIDNTDEYEISEMESSKAKKLFDEKIISKDQFEEKKK